MERFNQAERLINLGTASFGNQNPSHFMRLYQVVADRVRRGRINVLVDALSPELAAKKVDNMTPIDTSAASIRITDLAASFQKPIYGSYGRRLVLNPPCPPLVNVLSNAYISGYNDRLAYTGRQKATTRAKTASDTQFFLMGWNAAQRRINAQKPAKTRKKAKVA